MRTFLALLSPLFDRYRKPEGFDVWLADAKVRCRRRIAESEAPNLIVLPKPKSKEEKHFF
jgi:hypothetical protein